ncbi:MAG: YciI family protein [Bryobacteraceae bacterium]
MNYTILIYETAADFAIRTDPDPKKREAYWAAWPPYSKALKDAGVFVGGAGLQPPDTATTLKFQAEQRQVQDGPYADTKEQLGGFFMINVPDLDTALDWAARCPRAASRVFEVRPNLPPMSAER